MIDTIEEREAGFNQVDKRISGAAKHLVRSAQERVKAGKVDSVVILRQINPEQYKVFNHLTKGDPFIEVTAEDAFSALEDTNGPREGVILENNTKRSLGSFLDVLRKQRGVLFEEFGSDINGRWFIGNSDSPRKVVLEYHGSSDYGDTWAIRAYTQDPKKDIQHSSIRQRVARVLKGEGKNG